MSVLRVMVLLAAFVSSALAACNTPWKDCGSTGVTIDKVCLVGCNSAPCILHEGKNATLWYTFTPKADYSSMNQSAYGYVLHQWLPMPGGLANPDLCKILSCPLKSRSTYNVTTTLTVPPIKIQVLAEIRLEGKQAIGRAGGPRVGDSYTGCFELELSIQP